MLFRIFSSFAPLRLPVRFCALRFHLSASASLTPRLGSSLLPSVRFPFSPRSALRSGFALCFRSKLPSFRTLKTAQGPAILTRYLSHFAFRFRFSASRFSSSSALLFACLRSSPRPISISKLPCYHAFTADLSTLSSARGLTSLRYGSLLLEVGFTLRCLQRLSRPYFASLLCRWHDNSCTSGMSIPVLSY